MVFRQGDRRRTKDKRRIFPEEIEVVNKYKYLGFWFTPKNPGTDQSGANETNNMTESRENMFHSSSLSLKSPLATLDGNRRKNNEPSWD